jgi:signal transduction histidine kinase
VAEEARRRGYGSVGLGLAFCRLVAEAHQGDIRVDPNRPQGAIFTVEL